MSLFTVHPFGDEWAWDPETEGNEPMVLETLEQARQLAVSVRWEYVDLINRTSPDGDKTWVEGFWSEIWEWNETPVDNHGRDAKGVVGWVTPDDILHLGVPAVDDHGDLIR